MDILWSWKSKNNLPAYKKLALLQNDILHEVQFAANQQPIHYSITKFPLSLPKQNWIEWNAPCEFVPNTFADTNLPDLQTSKTVKINEQTSIKFSTPNHPNADHHFAELLWPIAQKFSNKAENSVYGWFHHNQYFLFAFQNGVLTLANSYHVNNAQECLYFTLLPFHQLKLKPNQLHVTIHTDNLAPWSVQAKQTFLKLIPHAEFTQPPLPIIAETQPPLIHFVAPLLQAYECASPVEI